MEKKLYPTFSRRSMYITLEASSFEEIFLHTFRTYKHPQRSSQKMMDHCLTNVKGPSISITFLSIIWWDKGCFILDTFKKQLLPLIISKVKIQTQYIWVISGFRKQHVSYLQILLEHIYGDAVSHFNGAFSSKRF